MKILLKNAKYLDENFDIKSGNILINNEYIEKISQNDEIADEVVDINGNLIMPGFMNMHTHTPMTLLRGLNDDSKLEEWLQNMFSREAKLTANDIYVGSKIGILNYIKNGITTFADMYYCPIETAKASAELGTNALIALGFVGNNTNTIENINHEIDEIKKLNQDYYFSCHSIYLRNREDFEIIENLAKQHNKVVHTHASETKFEVENCQKQHDGKSPIELLKDYGFFNQKSVMAHGVHLTDNDFEILKSADTAIISNPASNLKLGSGICPLSRLNNDGIMCGIATDGASSNNRLDMFREMFLASSLEKYNQGRCDLLSCKDILKMATINGAKAFGLDNVGLIKEGYRADLIEINTHSLNFVPHNNIINDLVFSATTEDILMTMCNGKILYQNGKFTNLSNDDLQKLYDEAENIVKRINNIN